jgi:hypothetical protein
MPRQSITIPRPSSRLGDRHCRAGASARWSPAAPAKKHEQGPGQVPSSDEDGKRDTEFVGVHLSTLVRRVQQDVSRRNSKQMSHVLDAQVAYQSPGFHNREPTETIP